MGQDKVCRAGDPTSHITGEECVLFCPLLYTFSKVKPVFPVKTPINCFFCPSSISLLSVEFNTFDPIPKSRPAFSQIATSVTEHPLPPVMREFKTSQTSTVHPASSSLPHLSILFFGDGRSRSPSSTFNFASSSAHHALMYSELLLLFFQDFLPRSIVFHHLQIEFHQLTLLQNRTI
ncbi:hypothetical protein AVEN_221424-1 [Araneus ventricosus]|uniref:Uncharacterized protein n=1 Tax=Araneus ventricosus TaxID=182803 RepID=A0A4Y2UH10_ARAVE|nr:hypothetical protein AVEN_221424-1 [Araneus ventricosus]